MAAHMTARDIARLLGEALEDYALVKDKDGKAPEIFCDDFAFVVVYLGVPHPNGDPEMLLNKVFRINVQEFNMLRTHRNPLTKVKFLLAAAMEDLV